MRFLSSRIVIVLPFVIVACSSSSSTNAAPAFDSDPCTIVGTCTNDQKGVQQASPNCATEVAGACGAKYVAYYDCRQTKEVCGQGGVVDTAASMTACKVALDALSACLAQPKDAGSD